MFCVYCVLYVQRAYLVLVHELPGFDDKSRALQRRFHEYKFPFSFDTVHHFETDSLLPADFEDGLDDID